MSPTHPDGTKLVTILLPAKNEEGAIGRTLRALPIATIQALGLDVEVLVLDGHSADRTAEIARNWGATVVEDREPGKGAAIRNALPRIRGDYVLMLDADGTYAPDALPRVLGVLLRDEAEIVMGHRLLQPGSMTPTHLLGNVALSMLASGLNGRFCLDVCTGLWGFKADALRRMPLNSRRFGLEVEMFALATRLGFRIERVRVDYLPRTGGPPKLSFGHDGLRILQRMMYARFGPLKPTNVEPPGPQPAVLAPGELQA